MRIEVSGEPARQISDTWFLEKFDEWTQKDPTRFAFAVDHSDHVDEYTYREVFDCSQRIAASLTATGIRPGDRVGILMDNSPQWVFALLGALRVGAIGVPLSTLLPSSSVRRLVDHADCSLVFTDGSNLETTLEALNGRQIPIVATVTDPAVQEWETFLKTGHETEWTSSASPDGTAVLMYTSGTTGDPKGVQIPSKGLSQDIYGLLELLELSPDHRMLSVLPFSHVLPLVANGLGALAAGCGVVFLTSISPQRIVEAFKSHRISFFVCVPQFFYAVHKRIFGQVAELGWAQRKLFGVLMSVSRSVKSPRLSRRLFSKIHNSIGPDLDLLITGGSRFEPRVARDFQALGYTMVQAYGLTETSAAATMTPVGRNTIGTVGVPLRGVRIRIDSPNDLGVGEVCVAGDILMLGYYLNPDASARAVRNGWLYTGDRLGQLDDDGNLTLTGRSKDVIVLATGKNIYPEEVEEHYEKCPYIKEMCVMGMPDSAGPGDTLHAVVVPDLDEFRKRKQTAIAGMIRYELENRSKELASFMRVHSLTVRNELLPRTVTRKLKRFQIYEEESARPLSKTTPAEVAADHTQLADGVGKAVVKAIRAAKPDLGALEPDMNFDLDLGFDSLGRVELLAEIEAELGVEIPEDKSNQILTIGELVQALEDAAQIAVRGPRGWKDKLTADGDEDLARQYIRESRRRLTYFGFPAIRLFGAIARIPFRTKVVGLENLPESGPFIICPNHVSYLDPFLLCSVLPFRIIRDIFILGYSDYFEGPVMSRVGNSVNIVPVDPNANLTRAMRIAAVGLRRNRILLVFPEGERSFDGGLTEFKKGASILSVELNVPIVPVGIRGTFEAWPRGGSLRPHPVEIAIGNPIRPKGLDASANPYKRLNDALKDAVAQLVS